MKTSKNGIDLIKKFEGLRLQAYKCPAGVLTIGYGHTKNVKENETITKAQADTLLLDDLFDVEKIVDDVNIKHCYNFTQNEFDAIVSFTFNCGKFNLLKLIRDGLRTKKQIAESLMLYVNANGKPLKGLVNRRLAEKNLFLLGNSNTEIKIEKGYNKLSLNDLRFIPKGNYNIRVDSNISAKTIGNTSTIEYAYIIGEKGDFFYTNVGYISKDAFNIMR